MLMLVGWNFEWTTRVSICCFADALYISDLGYSNTQVENGPAGPCGWGISLLWQNRVGHQYILLYCIYWLLSIKRENWDDDACDRSLLGVHRWLESWRWKGGVWWQGSGPQAMDELTTGVYIAARDWSIMHTYAYKYLGKKAPVGVMALCTVDDICFSELL